MKQHITERQLKELHTNKRAPLSDFLLFCRKRNGDVLKLDREKITIISMIKFLDINLRHVNWNYISPERSIFITRNGNFPFDWMISSEIIHGIRESFTRQELCDALWEMVKRTVEIKRMDRDI